MAEVQLCRRCKQNVASVVSRQDSFCNECFVRFVSLKPRKQLVLDGYYQDIFKVLYADKQRSAEEADSENGRSTVLVPLSLGSSSLAMLHILDRVLAEQKEMHRGKVGFRVHVLVCYFAGELYDMVYRLNRLKQEKLSDNLDCISFSLLDVNQFFTHADEMHSILLDYEDYTAKCVEHRSTYSLTDLLSVCPNKSSCEDVIGMVRTHLIKSYACQRGMKAILWGHSMTRVADEIISLVVKGRGSEIATKLNTTDMDSEFGSTFKNLYPLKDVLLSEVDAYCHISGLGPYIYNYDLQDTLLITKLYEHGDNPKPVKMAKNLTINELVRQYFDSIESDYSNVISTVVKTGGKFDKPVNMLSEDSRCILCHSNVHVDGPSWLKAITVNKGHPVETQEEEELLQMWESQLGEQSANLNLKAQIWCAGKDAQLCYGCIVILNGFKNRNIIWPATGEQELAEILEEFVLTDNDEG
ncbi:Ncs2p Ecym_8206 [Eremothecium cymbalariae DBVPG|uniref:Cytoplasmic tRNA 2-thiolation protein 2 n=1 Tax=Eremothecium cymbalariae (strain CBS 270.75 / DBVPG 7215 / KCTC 17166 / NRRL Y-17582) TaxID=931890 RepID=G8JXB7_ERECY|nr:Hypothetical protein Ecym_8206 [Eremothecium cymbalariae DBVPG\